MTRKLTKAETAAIEKLDELSGHDPEENHGAADDALLELVHPEVRAAYERLVDRADFWATA